MSVIHETPMLQLLRLEDHLTREWRTSASPLPFLDWVASHFPEHLSAMTYLAQLTL